jgi:glutathione S-transferase
VPVRMLDRVFDSHVMGPVQTIVFDARRPQEARDPYGVSQARNTGYDLWLA